MRVRSGAADLDIGGRLLLVSESAVFEPDEPDRRIRELVRAAGAAYDEGARDVAENLLWRAAARCFFQDADAPTRAETAAERLACAGSWHRVGAQAVRESPRRPGSLRPSYPR